MRPKKIIKNTFYASYHIYAHIECFSVPGQVDHTDPLTLADFDSIIGIASLMMDEPITKNLSKAPLKLDQFVF